MRHFSNKNKLLSPGSLSQVIFTDVSIVLLSLRCTAPCLPCLAMLSWMRSSTALSVLWPSCSCCPRTASLSFSSSNLVSSCWYAASILVNSAVSGPCSLASSVYLVCSTSYLYSYP